MDHYEGIATIRAALRKEAALSPLHTAIAEAERECRDNPVGFKASIANAKLRDAQTALTDAQAAITALYETIPAADEETVWLFRRVATLQNEEEDAEKRCDAIDAELQAALKAVNDGAWKRPGARQDPPLVVAARKRLDAAQTVLYEIRKRLEPLEASADETAAIFYETNALTAWSNGDFSEPMPASLAAVRATENLRILSECVALPVRRRAILLC